MNSREKLSNMKMTTFFRLHVVFALSAGMCMGVLPIVGLTLPFISYGGSSIISLFAMVGLVSGIHARPQRPVHERYVYAPIGLEIKQRRLKRNAEYL